MDKRSKGGEVDFLIIIKCITHIFVPGRKKTAPVCDVQLDAVKNPSWIWTPSSHTIFTPTPNRLEWPRGSHNVMRNVVVVERKLMRLYVRICNKLKIIQLGQKKNADVQLAIWKQISSASTHDKFKSLTCLNAAKSKKKKKRNEMYKSYY